MVDQGGEGLSRVPSFTGLQRSSSFASGRKLGGPGIATESTPLVHPPPGTILKTSPMESEFSFGEGRELAKAPSLLVWIWPALLCALAYALYNIFIKKGSASIHPILGGVILQIVAAFLGTLLLIFIVVQDGMDTLEFDRSGINWSILAGVAVGSAEMLSFFVMGMGVQATQAIPIGKLLMLFLLFLATIGDIDLRMVVFQNFPFSLLRSHRRFGNVRLRSWCCMVE